MEARDTELAIAHWKAKAERFGNPPPIAEFSLADLVAHSFRFIIGVDLLSNDDSIFLAYGQGFAQRLGLSERPSMRVPMIRCIPGRYRFLFLEGCSEATGQLAPVQFSGEVAGVGGSELYRACFMPLKMGLPTMLALYGSFNFRFRTAAELAEQSQLADAGGSSSTSDLRPPAAKLN